MSMAVSSQGIAARLLVARRALRGTEWDGSDLDQFVQVLCRLDGSRHGFDALDLLAVEAAWLGEPGETWSGGFVARLKDGKRVHVDGRAGGSQWLEEDSDIKAGLLDAGQPIPELGPRHGWQGHAWDDDTARRLNVLLDNVDAEGGAP